MYIRITGLANLEFCGLVPWLSRCFDCLEIGVRVPLNLFLELHSSLDGGGNKILRSHLSVAGSAIKLLKSSFYSGLSSISNRVREFFCVIPGRLHSKSGGRSSSPDPFARMTSPAQRLRNC